MTASRPISRTAFAFCLCLLAIIFAVEAKISWYGPIDGVSSDVRFSKACPAELSEITSQETIALHPVHTWNRVLFTVETAIISKLILLPEGPLARRYIPPSIASYFSPSAFFRPPPAL